MQKYDETFGNSLHLTFGFGMIFCADSIKFDVCFDDLGIEEYQGRKGSILGTTGNLSINFKHG